MIIKPGILRQICPQLHLERATNLEGLLNTVCPQYKIDSADIMHEFLANVIVESQCFARYEENLNYSAPRMHVVWPHRFPTIESGEAFVNNPVKLAAKVYDHRPDLGNINPGDGFMFRGSGPIQITGRTNFVLLNAYLRKQFGVSLTLAELAEKLRTSDEWGIHSACWLFAISKKLIDEAVNDNMLAIIKKITGGITGLDSRMHYYELCKRLIA